MALQCCRAAAAHEAMVSWSLRIQRDRGVGLPLNQADNKLLTSQNMLAQIRLGEVLCMGTVRLLLLCMHIPQRVRTGNGRQPPHYISNAKLACFLPPGCSDSLTCAPAGQATSNCMSQRTMLGCTVYRINMTTKNSYPGLTL